MSRLRFGRPSRPTVIACVALVVALGGQDVYAAATNFLLNTSNTSTAATTLNGSAVAGKALQVTNTNTGAGATALGLSVASGHAPFTVDSATKVAKLNAAKLDGLDSTQLQRSVTGSCGTAAISSITAGGGVVCSGLQVRSSAIIANHSFPDADSTRSFTTTGGTLLINFSASGYSTTTNRLIGADLIICDTSPCMPDTPRADLLADAAVYTNEAFSHKAMVGFPPLANGLSAGTYYLNVVPESGTVMDTSDRAAWTIIELSN